MYHVGKPPNSMTNLTVSHQFNLYHKLARSTTKKSHTSQHRMALFSSDCTNLLLYNSANQLAWAQSSTFCPHVSQIYVPNIGDWSVAKNCKPNSTKGVTQSLAELCANRSIDSMSINQSSLKS